MSTASIESLPYDWSKHLFIQAPIAMLLCAALLINFLLIAGHDRQRAVEIFTLLAFATFFLLRRCVLRGRVSDKSLGTPLTVFFLLGGLSTAMAHVPQVAGVEVSLFFLLYMLAAEVACEIESRGVPALRLMLHMVAVTAALYAFKFMVAYCAAFSFGNALTNDDFTPGFSNIRFFNHAQTSTLPLLILLCCLSPRHARLRWLPFVVSAYWWLALFATSGRGTLMGIVAGCAVAAVLLRRMAIPYLKQVARTAALGVLAYLLLLVAVPVLTGGQAMNTFVSTVERTAADPASGRLFLWHRALELILQHPLLGVGPMHFAHNAGDLHTGAHPHDWVMQIGSEWGLPALLCLITALTLAMRALLKAGRHIASDDSANQAIYTALVMGAVAILVDGLVSGLFVMPQSQLAIALFLGCAIGWYRTVVPAASTVVSSSTARVGRVLLIVAAMVGLGSVWFDLVDRWKDKPLTPAQQAANTGDQWPRLWKAGFF